MKSSVKKLPQSCIEILFEIPVDEFKPYYEKTLAKLSQELKMDGFRPGKAPKDLIEKEIGSEKILVEAAELAVKEYYIQTLLEEKVEAIGRPKIEILKLALGNPFEFKATVAVLPEVELPDYKNIACGCKKNLINVNDNEIQDALVWLQKSRAKLTAVSVPAKKGNWVEISFHSPQLNNDQESSDKFFLGDGRLLPGFEENLEGMSPGEEKEFSLTFPTEHFAKELAGKTVFFKVKMISVQEAEFPEINDTLARDLGQFDDLETLKKNIKEGLFFEKDTAESQRVRQEILTKIAAEAKFETPEIMLVAEKEKMLNDLKQRVERGLNISFEDYLAKMNKSEKEILDSLAPDAQKRINNFLVLREIANKEKIEAGENEIEEEIKVILRQYPNPDAAKKDLDMDHLKDYAKEAILEEKTLHYLESFTSNKD